MQFEDLIKKKFDKKFCIVGNSPNEISKSKGSLIDKFDTVVRFNDYSLDFEKDYGKKVDFWVRATNDKVVETWKAKVKIPYETIFLRSYSKNNENFRQYAEENEIKYEIFPIEYEATLSKKLQAIPSTGLLFLFILNENKIKLNRRNIFAFSFFDQKDILRYKTHHYFTIDSQESVGISQARHAWDREKKFFEKYILGEK